MTTLQYEKLDTARAQIRLLEVEPAPSDEATLVKCRLSTHFLETVPEYFALSYVWGSPNNTEKIIVNHQHFHATSNLVAFLHHFRSENYRALWETASTESNEDERAYIWIDAVCINQKDVAERSSQVRLMEDIYRRSSFVIAWLGEPMCRSHIAFTTILRISALINDAGGPGKLSWDHVDALYRTFKLSVDEFPDWTCLERHIPWSSVSKLLQRAYWTRIWTFQEMVLPKHVVFVCGDDSCTLDKVQLVSQWLETSTSGPCPPCVNSSVWMYLKVLVAGQTIGSLRRIRSVRTLHDKYPRSQAEESQLSPQRLALYYILILRSQGLEATDARDRIYGLLSLSTLPISPDYAKTEIEVFREFAAFGVRHGLVDSVLRPPNANIARSTGIPSWVPILGKDSERGLRLVGFTSRLVGAGANSTHEILSNAGNLGKTGVLRLTGVSVDVICRAGQQLWDVETLGHDEGIRRTLEQASSILVEVGATKIYPTGITNLEAMLRMMLGDADPRAENQRLSNSNEDNAQVFLALLEFLMSKSRTPSPESTGSVDRHVLGLGIPFDSRFGESFGHIFRLPESHAAHYGTLSVHDCLRSGSSLDRGLTFAHILYRSGARILLSERGFMGLGPPGMESNDVIVVTNQCSYPLVLRRSGLTYTYVGPSYVQGLMDGEAFAENPAIEDFSII